jgi:hypothetical protein
MYIKNEKFKLSMNSETRLKVGIFQENKKPSTQLCSFPNFETLTDGNISKSWNVFDEDAETKMSNEFIGKKSDHLIKNNRLDDLKGDSCSNYLNLDHLGNIKN